MPFDISSLSAALVSKVPDKTSAVYLIELDKKNDAPKKGDADKSSYVGFQYFPETLNDSKAVNYQQKEIPGGSLPLYQWVASGERLISFTAVFTCDVDYGATALTTDLSSGTAASVTAAALQGRLKSAGQLTRNPDLRGAVAWLRRYMLPTYEGDAFEGTNFTKAPNKLRLYIPNSGIGYAGGGISSNDSIYCVMTQCEVTYEAFFPSGWCRALTVSLSFAEIPQRNGGVYFPHANEKSGIQALAGNYTEIFPKG